MKDSILRFSTHCFSMSTTTIPGPTHRFFLSLLDYCDSSVLTPSLLLCYIPSLYSRQSSPLKITFGASLVAQWLRIRLPMQGTWVRALVREDPTCHGAAGPVRHNYWACTLEPVSHNYWAHAPQLLKPVSLEPVLCNKRSHCNEKPVHRNEE